MEKLIVIRGAYKPNTASINRLLSFLQGFEELEIEVLMVFLYPNESLDELDDGRYKHVRVLNLWKGHKYRNKWERYLFSFWNAWRFSRSLEPGSRVLVIESSEYVPFFIGRKGVKVYHERTEHHSVVPLCPRFLELLFLQCIPKLDGMLVISTSLRDTYHNLGAKRIEIINMTVDSNRFEGLKKQSSQEDYIAYCGTASNNKDGVDDLINAFAIVHSKKPAIKLFIIGKALSANDESGNRDLVTNLGLSDSVIFTGVISAEEMPQVLKNARIVALARPDSLQAQCGFPTKLGEYLLTANPVVVTRVGDIPLFLKDGVNALLVEPRCPKEFAEKLLWALDNQAKADVIGEAGRKIALTHFNYKTEAEKIIRFIYENVN